MRKKLTITIAEDVYDGLYRRIGKRRISQFIERLVRPHVLDEEMELAYRAMAHEEQREAAAETWSDALITDADDGSR